MSSNGDKKPTIVNQITTSFAQQLQQELRKRMQGTTQVSLGRKNRCADSTGCDGCSKPSILYVLGGVFVFPGASLEFALGVLRRSKAFEQS